ncbi:MAG: type I-MYXAN CRISPR-associated Cas8a1/Cmx1, partial [Thermomicrobiales bacterium]
MAAKRKVKPKPPSSLTMRLHAPGMTILHRAGLGGLACTLRYIERAFAMGALLDDELPGTWSDTGEPPWTITPHEITLNFGTPENAGEYLKRLFALGLTVKDGLIYLPGQYHQEPSLAVRAELQNGLTLTFLQHGRVRNLAKQETVLQVDPVGDGSSFVTVTFKRCESFKHQEGWAELVDKHGKLNTKPIEVIGPLNPGAVVRHVAFNTPTRIVAAVDNVLPLYFAIVGAIALPVNRGVGTLIVPDVVDLEEFTIDRPLLTPVSVKECRVAERSDAVMQAKVRLRKRGALSDTSIPAFLASIFKPTAWASQQKSRTWTQQSSQDDSTKRYEVEGSSRGAQRLDQFAVALALLPPRVHLKTETIKVGKGRRKETKQRTVAFWTDSVIRPLIADNLANDRHWYHDFTSLMRDSDINGNPYRHRLFSEREALGTMTETIEFDYPREHMLVRAVHKAIAMRLARIKADTQGEANAPTT